MKDTDRLICVREFWTEGEASIAQALLEEHGIESATQGGQIRTTLNYYGSVIEGVKVFVAEPDALRAEQLLQEVRSGAPDLEEASDEPTTPMEFPPEPQDDASGLTETGDDRARRLMRGGILGLACIPVLLITIPLLFSLDRSKLTPRGERNRAIGIGLLFLTITMWGLALTALSGGSVGE